MLFLEAKIVMPNVAEPCAVTEARIGTHTIKDPVSIPPDQLLSSASNWSYRAESN